MKSEDAQLSKDTSDLDTHNTVLVASHGSNNQRQHSGNVVSTVSQSQGYGPQHQGYGTEYDENASQQQCVSGNSQQYFPSTNPRNNNNRGKRGQIEILL